MRLYFSQYVTHQDGSKPTLIRSAFGLGLSRGYTEFLVLFHDVWFLISRAFAQGYLCHVAHEDGKAVIKRASSVRFVITLKF